MVGHAPEWEPWEARRASLPRRPDPETREARQDARLLLMVVRARFADGTVPYELTDALAQAMHDERLADRQRRQAAQCLARFRGHAMRTEARQGSGVRGPCDA